MMAILESLPPSKIPAFAWSKTSIPKKDHPIRNPRFLTLYRCDLLPPPTPGSPHLLLASPLCPILRRDPDGPQASDESSILLIRGTEEAHVEGTAKTSTRTVRSLIPIPCRVTETSSPAIMPQVVARELRSPSEGARAVFNRNWRIMPEGLYNSAASVQTLNIADILRLHRNSPGLGELSFFLL
jgi:hypothetical protein